MLHKRPTIGILSGWQIFEGTTLGNYLQTLFRGMRAAAHDCDSNLLIACGISSSIRPGTNNPAWPLPLADCDFIPVGPWNCDGLIVFLPNPSAERQCYIEDLVASEYPVVCIGPGGIGRSLAVDNRRGVFDAIEHLVQHGHRQIAFVAGPSEDVGDSFERRQAFQAALEHFGIPFDPALVVCGRHHRLGGQAAVQQLLAASTPFSAVLASNDVSATGVVAGLRAARLRVPNDVAVIGFDDQIEARAELPPLTTIHQPVFEMGYRAVELVLDTIHGNAGPEATVRVAPRLAVRRSCGCWPGVSLGTAPSEIDASVAADTLLAQRMTERTLFETQHLLPSIVHELCAKLLSSFHVSVQQNQRAPFAAALVDVLQRVETTDDEPHAWQAAISLLNTSIRSTADLSPEERAFAQQLLDQARVAISESAQRQAARTQVQQRHLADQVGMMTAQLLTQFDREQIRLTLDKWLPAVGIQWALAAFFEHEDDDPVAWSKTYVCVGGTAPERFSSRQFPPPACVPHDKPLHLALLPMVSFDEPTGFVAFEAETLEPCAAIVQNLAAAIRGVRLYHDALDGRRMAEEANHQKGRFLSTVSHELRTPLNLIVGLSEMMTTHELDTALPNALQYDIESIRSSAHHLSQLVSDVLDLASSEAGRLRLMREQLDLGDALQPILATCAHMAHERGLRWRVELPSSPVEILGDRTRLRQVVLNLVSNAVKFTRQGSVTLTLSVTPDAAPMAAIEIADTGLGIAIKDQVLMFEEFRRLERTQAMGYRGMGLGLAISRQLIELHGGTISVQSTGVEGEGTTFRVTLPLLAPSTSIQPLATLPAVQALFLVDGDTDQRLAAYLREQGSIVSEAQVDDVAWAGRVRSGQYAAVIVDAQLAATHGQAIMRTLQHERTARSVPLLVYTFSEADGRGALMEFGTLPKPATPDALAQALAYYLPAGGAAASTIVLVVDDDPGMLDLHSRMIQRLPGYAVAQARHGNEALAFMAHTLPDLVLLDLVMPELDGFATLEAMRAAHHTRNVPVLILTAQVLTDTDMERLNQGVAAILAKGVFSADETLAHIQTALDRNHKYGTAAQRVVRRAIVYIQTHHAEPLTREQIAHHVGVNANHLTDCFHQELGITPITYLTRYRVRQARQLLEHGTLNVTEVALAVGFADSGYFGRIFVREVGVPPGAYRRGQRHGDA